MATRSVNKINEKSQGKRMRPNPKSTTPRYVSFVSQTTLMLICSFRNLYAIDYMKDHPHTTTPEYNAIWENLDQETKEVSIYLTHLCIISNYL